jgi:hypothetical protein
MNDRQVQLNLSGRVSFSEEITVAQAVQIMTFVVQGPDNALVTTIPDRNEQQPAEPNAASLKKVTTPREAIEVSGAKTNSEKIVALTAFALQDRAQGTLTGDSIKPLFREAREQQPGNFPRDLDRAIRAGWIGEGPSKGDLFLTAKAEGVLEHGFGSIRPKRGSAMNPRGNGRKPRRLTKPDTFSAIDDFPHAIEGIPSFHDIKLKRDKMLWVLKLASDLDVPALSNTDIMWLTDHLGDCIQTRDINGYFQVLRKAGLASRSASNNSIRITPGGVTYLESLDQSNR